MRVRAADESGEVVHQQELAHGADPMQLLLSAGFAARWVGAHRVREEVVLEFEVVPAERPVPHQRPAAYAVVVADHEGARSLLLTSFTNGPADKWGLPGGGIDPGEDPADAAVREVWEETGQCVTDLVPLVLESGHWTGRSPAGRLEDFHALRMVYRAQCARPTTPVVQDVGGSTDRAQWVPVDQVPGRRLQAWTPRVLDAAGP